MKARLSLFIFLVGLLLTGIAATNANGCEFETDSLSEYKADYNQSFTFDDVNVSLDAIQFPAISVNFIGEYPADCLSTLTLLLREEPKEGGRSPPDRLLKVCDSTVKENLNNENTKEAPS